MEYINGEEYLKTDELIYWIDKSFVQQTALDGIGRELNDEELADVTKLLEFGLIDAVLISVKAAIKEAAERLIEA